MAIDFNAVLNEFIRVAREALDGQLSEIGPTGNQFPAVIKVRQTGPKPEYPYCTVDILDIDDGGEWLLQEYLNENDELVYQSNKNLLINYRVYGGNAINIANNLHGYFRVDRVLNSIRQNTGGAVVTVDSIDSLPILLSDSDLESASFNITFVITDTLTLVDDGENYFDSIDLDGELKDGEGDANPLIVNVNAP